MDSVFSASTSGPCARTVMNRLRQLSKSPLFHIVVWLIPLAAVIWWATKQKAPQWPDTPAEIAWVAGALLVYVVVTLMRGERWHRLLHSSGIDAGRGDSYGLTVVGYAGNNVLPARGGEILRVFLLSSRTGAQRRTVVGTIIAERMLDAIALGGILLIVAYNLVRDFGAPSPAVALAVVIAAVALVLAVAYGWWRHRHHAERLIDAVKPIIVPLRPLIGMRGVVLLAGSVVIWITEATVYGMVAESVGINLGLRGALAVVAFTNLAMLIPGAPGNAGTYDGAVIYSTRKITGTTNALAYDLMLRLVIFVPISVVGMVLLFVRYGGLARLRAAREAASANAAQASPQVGAVALGADGPVGDPLPETVEAQA